MEVTLDVVHTDDAALVADLERRLGGQVLRHQVKDIDYVRDIMVVDVRFRPWVRRPEFRLEQPVAGPRPVNGQAVNPQAPSSRSPSARRPGADRPSTGRSANGQAQQRQLRNGQVTGVRS